MPLVSIIVPVYNVKEEYVLQCMESIRLQTYKNIEVWVIDDGNDEPYARWLDSMLGENIYVHHQINQGVSAARNKGIELSRGEYLYFCDPDDVMHVKEIEILVKNTLEYEADIAACGFIPFSNDNSIDIYRKLETTNVMIYEDDKLEDVMLELLAYGRSKHLYGISLSGKYPVYCTWGHLYKKAFIKTVRFPPQMHPSEDIIFNLMVLENIKRVIFIDSNLHHYRTGYGIMYRFRYNAICNDSRKYEFIERFTSIRQWVHPISAELSKARMDMIGSCMRGYFLHRDNPLSKGAILGELFQFLRSEENIRALRNMTNPYYSFKQRVLCIGLLALHKLDKLLGCK